MKSIGASSCAAAEHLLEVDGALAPSECASIIRRFESAGFEPMRALYPPDYRDNDRLVVDDAALAAQLAERLARILPREIERDGDRWRLVGLNERFRSCRYEGGQSFRRHRDGPHFRSADERSWLTVMAYLNDGGEFDGGRTRFYAGREPDAPILAAIRPRTGSLVIFDHALWHDGEPVVGGRKYVLRTDVMYRRVEGSAGFANGDVLRHPGYVWRVVSVGDGRLATACRDGRVRRWTAPVLDSEWSADAGSVTALAAIGSDLLATGSRKGRLRTWDGSRAAGEVGTGSAVLDLARGAEGSVLAALADGAWLRLDMATGRVERVASGSGWVWGIAQVSRRAIASASDDGVLRLWSDATRPMTEARAGAPLRSLAAGGPDGAFATGDAAGRLSVWRLDSGRLVRATQLDAHQGAVRALTWLPDGRLASGGEDDCVRVWSASRCVCERRHRDFVTSLATLPDGSLASASYDGTVRVGRV